MTAPNTDEMMDPGGPYAGLTKAEYQRRITTPGTKEFAEYAPPGYVFHNGAWVLDSQALQDEIAAETPNGTPPVAETPAPASVPTPASEPIMPLLVMDASHQDVSGVIPGVSTLLVDEIHAHL